jgi:hypothetical protein
VDPRDRARLTMPRSVFLERVQKLRAASSRELASRLRYKGYLLYERRRWKAGAYASQERWRRALDRRVAASEDRLVEARGSRRPAWFASLDAPDRARAIFSERYPAEARASIHDAAAVRDQRFSFFGHSFHFEQGVPWTSDPVTGREWPQVFHADVPIHGGDVGYGDVKHVWELNRHQDLVDLAKSHFLRRDPADLAALERLVRSWVAANPYGMGINWSCALEPAFRSWSWLWAYAFTAGDLPRAFHALWLRAFYDHGSFLARHLELYSSPYNHLIGEASALYALGLLFPEFREARLWRDRGRGVLEARLEEQFYADGGSVEQSTFYHHATTGFYLLSALLARAHGEELSSRVWAALERALDFSLHLSMPDGRTPAIGGADDGKPIRLEHLPLWDFRPYLAIGAVLFKRPDLKAAAGRFHEDAFWLLGPDGLTAFESLDVPAPRETAILLPRSGYAVSRSSWSGNADYVCVDVGEQAAGMRTDAVPNSMHGHADCLSLVAALDGHPILVDAGFYAYNSGGEWEAHFRETAAHNTARIDGRDQAKHLGKMAWSHSYRATVEGWFADDRQCWVVGSHDGYARGPEGVVHRRAVWRRPGGYIVVYDEFVGHGQHQIEVNFQFAPGVLSAANGSVMLDDRARLVWTGNIAWTATTTCGGPGPQDGWICDSLGVRRAAPRLTLRAHSQEARTVLLTVLADAGRAGDLAVVSRDAGLLVAVGGAGFVDWIAASALSGGTAVRTDALVAICRVADEALVEQAHVQGTFVDADVAGLPR